MLHPRWPWRLNKHLEVICVHLGLLFSSPCSSSSSHQGAALELAALSPCYLHHAHTVNVHTEGCPPEELDQDQEILRCAECDQPGHFIRLSSPPLICLRHHSLGAGRHSLHQACANISQVSAPICISLLPITTSACARRHVRTHGMRSQTESRRPRTCSCANNQNQFLPHANECKPGLHA